MTGCWARGAGGHAWAGHLASRAPFRAPSATHMMGAELSWVMGSDMPSWLRRSALCSGLALPLP
jgi:hypothetical protein